MYGQMGEKEWEIQALSYGMNKSWEQKAQQRKIINVIIVALYGE